MAELNNNMERNRQEMTNVKEEFLVKQNKYVVSLEKELTKVHSNIKQHTDELQDIQIAIDNKEEYSRKTSLEFCVILEEVDMFTDQVVVADVHIQEDDIEILPKFVSHKAKLKAYNAIPT